MDDRTGQSLVHSLHDGGTLVGFIAIDSTINGRARGGLRMMPDVGAGELQAAARAMTLKYGFLGLPQGGAKGGVLGDPEQPVEARRERLQAFARGARDLLRDGRYLPDADMGTTAAEIRWMMQHAGLPAARRDWRNNRSGRHTAASCLAAVRAALAHRGRSLDGCRVAVEGFGQVGSALVQCLHEAGAKVVAISTSAGALFDPKGLDVPDLAAHSSAAGSATASTYGRAERLPREALFELPVDVLCPCARIGSIHAGNVTAITAEFVCAGANNPVTPDAENALWRRGVVVPPDFISNSGGVLGGTLEFAGVSAEATTLLIERLIGRAVATLLAHADAAGAAPRAIAEPRALERHARVRAAAEQPTLRGRAMALGLECYRRGWLPSALVGAMAPAYVERRLHT